LQTLQRPFTGPLRGLFFVIIKAERVNEMDLIAILCKCGFDFDDAITLAEEYR
jgi:hypothetical protein